MTAQVTVDVRKNRRPISPLIYGVSHAAPEQLRDLNVPLNRNGGNNASRYNWQWNADNRGADWYFQSLPDESGTPGARIDTFISRSREGGAEPMLTMPMIGWLAKLGPNRTRLASFSQTKYGLQTGQDWRGFADAGNGILQETNLPVQDNDPHDANVPNSPAFQAGLIATITQKWGNAQNGGVRYYMLDNEPSIWHESHRDVQPIGATMDEILEAIKNYASAIKSVDPGASVLGPEEWGWNGYLYSGYDLQRRSRDRWAALPDRMRHGDMDYIPWLLTQLKADGRHLLDMVTLHYYPQGGEFSNDVTTQIQLLRNRSTRSLWDPDYVDQSWIREKVILIPRLRNWVNTCYDAGTPIGITEYNWGADNHINGATAQADVLGILGREGVDLAVRWMTPDVSTPAYKAIQMYRNYDGRNSTFGDVSVAANGPDPDNISVFASERTSDGALTVMVISKQLTGETQVNMTVEGFGATGTAQVFQLTSANAITRLPEIAYVNSAVSFRVASQSITLLVVSRTSALASA